jgi:hypothetical protein
MKFFTRQWANNDMTEEETETIPAAYFRHLEAIDLPRPVLDLASINPHDAYVLEVEYTSSDRTLHLLLRCGDLQAGYFDALLNFSNAEIEPPDLASLINARRPAKFEILYDEVDRVDKTMFEYRLLLHPVGEVTIRFQNVAIDRRPVADRSTK